MIGERNTSNKYVYTVYSEASMVIRPKSKELVDAEDEINKLYATIQNVIRVRNSLATQPLNDHAVKQLDKALEG